MTIAPAVTAEARAKRVGLAAAAALVTANIWTGAPLLALWVGSRFVGSSQLSMGAVAVVVIVLGTCVIALVVALGHLSEAYDRAAGVPPGRRRTSPWLRSMRGERAALDEDAHRISAIERIVVLSVGACAAAFNVWFFCFAGSPMTPA